MEKTYIVKPGYGFVRPDGSVANGGDRIELASDVAHANRLAVDELVAPAAGNEITGTGTGTPLPPIA